MAGGDAELLGLDFRPSPLRAEALEGFGGGLELGAVAGAGDDRRLADGKPLLGVFARRSTSSATPSPVLADSAKALIGAERPAFGADLTRSILLKTRIWRELVGIGARTRRISVGGGIDHPQHEIRILDSLKRPPDPLRLDRTLSALIPAVSVTMTGNPRRVEMDLDDIACGPRLLRHDCRVAPRERIEQRRLADVGRSGDDDAEAVAEAFASAVHEMLRHGGEQLGDRSVSLHRCVGGDIGLVGEV